MFEVELRERIAALIGEALAQGWSIRRREAYVALCDALEKLAERR
jgi:hypothetical protein